MAADDIRVTTIPPDIITGCVDEFKRQCGGFFENMGMSASNRRVAALEASSTREAITRRCEDNPGSILQGLGIDDWYQQGVSYAS